MEAVSDLNFKLINVYSTPIWQSEFPNFLENKEEFLKSVKEYKEETNNQGLIHSNVNGYQSLPNLHSKKKLSILFDYICSLAKQSVSDLQFIDCDVFISSSWSNINDSKNCINSEHIHGDTFSGVFYLKAPKGSGSLCFRNIGINPMWAGCELTTTKNQYTGEVIKVKPVEGNIMLWPSYLPHSVEPNNHDDERISISFNIVVLPKNSVLKELILNKE
jgi:uncharacterized protein (TIGR02466 family)